MFSGWLHAADQCLDQPGRRVRLQDPYSLWTAEIGTQGKADGTLLFDLLSILLFNCTYLQTIISLGLNHNVSILPWCICLADFLTYIRGYQKVCLNLTHLLPLLLALLIHFAVAAGVTQDRKWRAEGATHSVWWAGWRWLWGPESTSWWHPHWNGISFLWEKLSLCTKLPRSIFDM